MFKDFLQAKKYLYGLIPVLQKEEFPGRLGLLRMADLLQRLDNPQKEFISVHITGTAGKSSTSYLISTIMQRTGLKVGLTISPHLQTMRERFQINGKLITEKRFISLINQIKPLINQMAKKSPYGKPSYFEVLLAASFLYFTQEKVDLAVIEAGLGGKYDGTNVLKPKIAVLTNCGLDHTNILGKTKQTILKDKMEIIKPACATAVTGIKQNYLLKIIKEHCHKQKVPLFIHQRAFKAKLKSFNPQGSKFDFIFQKRVIKNINLNLPGLYQIDNACLAIATCLKLNKTGKFRLTHNQIKKALQKAFFPGRMEIISQKPLVILDGAHNEDKIKALLKSIKKLYPKKKFTVIFGVKKDKDARKMLLSLKKISQDFIITQFDCATDLGFKLNYPAKELFQLAQKIDLPVKISLKINSQLAFKKAKANNKSVLITGSLYLVGEARQFFNLKPNHSSVIPSGDEGSI